MTSTDSSAAAASHSEPGLKGIGKGSSNGSGNGNPRVRRLGLSLVLLAVLVGAAVYIWWWLEHGQRYISTDNAYVQGNLVLVTAQTPGTVVAIHAGETDRVIAGQTLVALAETDARLALTEAEAELAQTVRELQTVYAGDGSLRAQITLRSAELARARADGVRTAGDLTRRQRLADSGAISDEEIRHAEAAAAVSRNSIAVAGAALNTAREGRSASRMLVAGTTVENHPNVRRAAAKLRAAHVALHRTTIPAPLSGHVARRSVQVGQRIAAGTALMTLVALEQVWVDANFKESQLANLRLGQPVRLSADLYGNQVKFTGTVAGLAVGTGAAFALLPAQNATGNWIKVVQRVPVRITLDTTQLLEHPLRVGLSMRVEIDVSKQDGKLLAETPTQVISQTGSFDSTQAEADADSAALRIIQANLVVPEHAQSERETSEPKSRIGR